MHSSRSTQLNSLCNKSFQDYNSNICARSMNIILSYYLVGHASSHACNTSAVSLGDVSTSTDLYPGLTWKPEGLLSPQNKRRYIQPRRVNARRTVNIFVHKEVPILLELWEKYVKNLVRKCLQLYKYSLRVKSLSNGKNVKGKLIGSNQNFLIYKQFKAM